VVAGNEQRFSRWTVGLCVQCSNSKGHFTVVYRNQWHLLYDLLTTFSRNNLKVTTCQFHSKRCCYAGNNYYEKKFLVSIDEFYQGCGL